MRSSRTTSSMPRSQPVHLPLLDPSQSPQVRPRQLPSRCAPILVVTAVRLRMHRAWTFLRQRRPFLKSKWQHSVALPYPARPAASMPDEPRATGRQAWQLTSLRRRLLRKPSTRTRLSRRSMRSWSRSITSFSSNSSTKGEMGHLHRQGNSLALGCPRGRTSYSGRRTRHLCPRCLARTSTSKS